MHDGATRTLSKQASLIYALAEFVRLNSQGLQRAGTRANQLLLKPSGKLRAQLQSHRHTQSKKRGPLTPGQERSRRQGGKPHQITQNHNPWRPAWFLDVKCEYGPAARSAEVDFFLSTAAEDRIAYAVTQLVMSRIRKAIRRCGCGRKKFDLAKTDGNPTEAGRATG